jgi:hypothetical protein
MNDETMNDEAMSRGGAWRGWYHKFFLTLTSLIAHGNIPPAIQPATATLIQRGGGTGPMKPRQPSGGWRLEVRDWRRLATNLQPPISNFQSRCQFRQEHWKMRGRRDRDRSLCPFSTGRGFYLSNLCYADNRNSPQRARSSQRFLIILCVLCVLCGKTVQDEYARR